MSKQKYKHENCSIPISEKAIENLFKMKRKLKWNEYNDNLYWSID